MTGKTPSDRHKASQQTMFISNLILEYSNNLRTNYVDIVMIGGNHNKTRGFVSHFIPSVCFSKPNQARRQKSWALMLGMIKGLPYFVKYILII